MKKILPVLAVSASLLAVASCSNSKSATIDKNSQTERLGAEWFYQDNKVEYNDVALNLPESGSFEGAHFTLSAPKDASNLIKSHFVAIPKNLNKEGKIRLTYASPRYYELTSFQDAIATTVNDNKEELNALLPSGYSVQTAWSVEQEIASEDNIGLFIEYMPLRFNYYKDTDETVESNAVLYTYVIVPVRVIVTNYSLNNEDSNYQTKYTFNDPTAESLKPTLIDWTQDAYGRIK